MTLHQLHGEEVEAPLRLHRVQRDDVGVVERRDGPRLPAEALQAPGVRGRRLGQHLQGHLALQLGVVGPPHHAHGPLADDLDEPILDERLAGLEGHEASVRPHRTMRREYVRRLRKLSTSPNCAPAHQFVWLSSCRPGGFFWPTGCDPGYNRGPQPIDDRTLVLRGSIGPLPRS